jgi:hypothetical protein
MLAGSMVKVPPAITWLSRLRSLPSMVMSPPE